MNSLQRNVFFVVCPNGWINVQGSCYKISSNKLNWNASKSACEALGSKLVSINSQAEQQAIASLQMPNEWIWIGLYKNPTDKSQWLWVDGSRATYTHWRSGEPNNSGGQEDCGNLFSKTRGRAWNDLPCRSSLRYICEIRGKSERTIDS